MGSENEVRGYRGANVGARVGGRGPDRGNTLWVHGATGGVHWLWPVQDINAVLSGERSHAKQQYGSPVGQREQLFHLSLLMFARLRSAAVNTPSGCGMGSKQFVPRKNEISQFAYEAIKKHASFAQPVAVNLRPSAGCNPHRKDAGSGNRVAILQLVLIAE
jgi:hypothetical protein